MPASKACVERTQIAARAAVDKFGTELVALDLSDQTVLSEVFLIVTASNSKIIDTIADEVEEQESDHSLAIYLDIDPEFIKRKYGSELDL